MAKSISRLGVNSSLFRSYFIGESQKYISHSIPLVSSLYTKSMSESVAETNKGDES